MIAACGIIVLRCYVGAFEKEYRIHTRRRGRRRAVNSILSVAVGTQWFRV
jgi:hypothetical protein